MDSPQSLDPSGQRKMYVRILLASVLLSVSFSVFMTSFGRNFRDIQNVLTSLAVLTGMLTVAHSIVFMVLEQRPARIARRLAPLGAIVGIVPVVGVLLLLNPFVAFFLLIPPIAGLVIAYIVAISILFRRYFTERSAFEEQSAPFVRMYGLEQKLFISFVVTSVTAALQWYAFSGDHYDDNRVEYMLFGTALVIAAVGIPLAKQLFSRSAPASRSSIHFRIAVLGIILANACIVLFTPAYHDMHSRGFASCTDPAFTLDDLQTITRRAQNLLLRENPKLEWFSHYDGYTHRGTHAEIQSMLQPACDTMPIIVEFKQCLLACGVRPTSVPSGDLYAAQAAHGTCTYKCYKAAE